MIGDPLFKPGDRVGVIDTALMAKREVEPRPNHHGTVTEVLPEKYGRNEETLVFITFDSEGEAMGNNAPYPISEVYALDQGQDDI